MLLIGSTCAPPPRFGAWQQPTPPGWCLLHSVCWTRSWWPLWACPLPSALSARSWLARQPPSLAIEARLGQRCVCRGEGLSLWKGALTVWCWPQASPSKGHGVGNAAATAVGGLLFLRLLSPAIITPHAHGLVDSVPRCVALRVVWSVPCSNACVWLPGLFWHAAPAVDGR